MRNCVEVGGGKRKTSPRGDVSVRFNPKIY